MKFSAASLWRVPVDSGPCCPCARGGQANAETTAESLRQEEATAKALAESQQTAEAQVKSFEDGEATAPKVRGIALFVPSAPRVSWRIL